MKIKAKFLLSLALFVAAMNTNPGPDKHRNALMKGMQQMNLTPSFDFIEQCEFHDYLVFSFCMYLGKPVTFGLFGNVHTVYQNLEPSLAEFHTRNSVLPNLGRGAPYE